MATRQAANPTGLREVIDARLGVAGLLVIASTFVLASGVAYTCYVATAALGSAGYDAYLGGALSNLAEVAATAGILALAAIVVEWFAIHDGRAAAGARRRPAPDEIRFFRGPLSLAVALGVLVFAAGLAGIAGATLSASARSVSSPGSGWYSFEQVATSVATATLGIAVTVASAWSLHTYFPREQPEPSSADTPAISH